MDTRLQDLEEIRKAIECEKDVKKRKLLAIKEGLMINKIFFPASS